MTSWVTTLSLVFGGCCSNAITLETLTTQYKAAGTLITFLQFLVITLYCLPAHLRWTSWGPTLAPRRIPLAPYVAQVLLFYALSLLNNWAFQYDVPMSIHIIFRSGGLVVSLFLGWLIAGKKYSLGQVLSVLLVTSGVLLTTFSVHTASKKAQSTFSSYWQGIFLLFIALILGGLLGLVQDYTYSNLSKWEKPQNSPASSSTSPATATITKGLTSSIPITPALQATSRNVSSEEKTTPPTLSSPPPPKKHHPTPPWKESLFYLHFLGLPLFWIVRQDIIDQAKLMFTTSDKATFSLPVPFLHTLWLGNAPTGFINNLLVLSPNTSNLLLLTLNLPSPVIPLIINTLTQLVCVTGVNRLTTQVSSLSVTMVLVLRKAVSLVISVLDFNFLPIIGSWLSPTHLNTKKGKDVDMVMLWSGAFLVLVGSILYSDATGRRKKKELHKKTE